MEQVVMKVTEEGRNKLIEYIRAYIYGSASKCYKKHALHSAMASIHNQLRQPSWDFKKPEDLVLNKNEFREVKKSTSYSWISAYTSKESVEYVKYITEHYEYI